MTDMSVLPIEGGMGSAGSAGVGGAIGGLIGSWFGNGWGGNGNGNWGGRGAGAEGVVIQNSLDTNAILNAINSGTMSTIQGQNGTNLTVERAAASTFTGLTSQNTQNLLASVQGFAGLNTVIQNGTSQVVSAIGAADVNALTRSFQAQLEQQRCCCETNANISREAEATRALIRDQFAQSQAVLICDLKSQLAASRFETSQAVQTGVLTAQNVHLAQLINFKIPTPPTPPTA